MLDVVVDLRKASSTFGRVLTRELSATNREMLFIPEGFAHGFLTLEEASAMVYLASPVHSPPHDAGIAWDSIDFRWPVKEPVLTTRPEVPALRDFQSLLTITMKILFTGASSFTGFWFIKTLAAAGHEIICPVTGNLVDYADLRLWRVEQLKSVCRFIPQAPFGSENFLKAIRENRFDLLCHHAAEARNTKALILTPFGRSRTIR